MAHNKKRAGVYKKSKIKTSEFLPGIFQTNLNKRWLDSTLDQMVSKGPLRPVEGYIGKLSGKYATSEDQYITPPVNAINRDRSQLSPAILTTAKDGSVENAITFDDIIAAVNSNFSDYNYNSAYASAIYGYHPPIDPDKFVNFANYYWVEELPVYEAVRNSGDLINPVTESLNKELYTVIDDNNTFNIDNNMLIKFTGFNWDPAVQGKTYIVTGVGEKIKLFLYRDEQGKRYYTSANKGDVKFAGFWDSTDYYTVSPNTENQYWDINKTPQELIDAYNSDQTSQKLPIFDGFNFTNIESNPTMFTPGVLIKFSSDWNISDLEKAKIYYTQKDQDTGEISLRVVIDAEYDGSGNISTSLGFVSLPDDQPILNLLEGWDKDYWDSAANQVILKDYHVISKHDNYQTAWSRNNNWVNINTIHKLKDLLGELFSTNDYINQDRIAKRPIIEFNANIELWNFGSDDILDRRWIGIIDFILDPQDPDYPIENDGFGNLKFSSEIPVSAGSRVVFKIPESDGNLYKNIFIVESNGNLTIEDSLFNDNTAFINNSVQESLEEWVDSDAYFDGDSWILGQQKTKNNQPPIYRLYDYKGTPLENYPRSSFNGSKIFGYCVGTGENDPELGFPLIYQDSPKGAEFKFENYILTKKHTESFTSSIDQKVSHYQTIPGLYFFKKEGLLGYIYQKNEVIAGTRQEHVYEITNTDQDFKIPFGFDDWRYEKEILIHAFDNRPRISEIVGNGVYLDKTRTIVVGTNQTLVVHNLVTDSSLIFTTVDGVDVTPVVESDGFTYNFNIGNVGDTVYNINVDVNPELSGFDDVKIIVTDNIDTFFHRVFINGKPLALREYTINADSIVINKELLSVGDLVDFEYYNNSPKSDQNTALPSTMNTNPNNELMETFTISETLSHWSSIISSQPGIQGSAFGFNNYSDIVKINNIGGTIHVHADLSIMHDLSYSNQALDITGALIEQGSDWDGFVERFKNQVRRLYSTKTYATVFDIVSDAMDAVTLNRKGSVLYRDSNMAFSHQHNQEIIELQDNSTVYFSKYVVNGDDNIRDHMYIYLTDDRDANGQFIQRLLTKDVDYFVVGNRIDLLITPNKHSITSKQPFLTISYHYMDEESFVPPSPVKLKLQNAHIPQVVDDVLITHDGRKINLKPNTDLEDTSSENFDPVNAALYDLEKRIYAGLVSPDLMYQDRYISLVTDYANAYAYLPSQHRETWYTLEQINNYLEKFFQKWARKRDIIDLNPENYYDPLDPFTWNYSSISIGEHFTGNQLPGHWVGAYITLFGTATPHLTPWHMLGHTFKPQWWDEYYSWTDPVKRQQLIKSLKFGVIDRPRINNEIRFQDSLYARYYWDWENKCPVDTNGNLVTPDQVLGSTSAVNAAKPFEFGDWGPVEQYWRSSSQGYMALVDAVIKLNPARAWTEFFHPGITFKNRYVTNDLNLYTKELQQVNQYPVPGKIYNNVVGSIYFKNDLDYFSTTETNIRIADGDNTIESKVKIAYLPTGGFIQDGKLHNKISAVSVISRGRNYISEPAVLNNFSDSENQQSEFEINLIEVPYVSVGVSQAQYNYTLRRQYNTDLDQIYSTLHTQLAQKVGGFTSKHLVNLYADSSIQGAFRLSDNDYQLRMYQGYPTEITTASQVTITKTETGYAVSGISSEKQEFKFYEPDMTNISGATSVAVGTTSVTKYKRYAGNPSTIQYGAKLAKIQDTYNFIRGYWHWMELSGYQLSTKGDAQATKFVQWAVSADDDESITLKIGNTIKFTPVFGSVYEYNKFHYHRNDVLDNQGDIISNEDLSVDRLEGTVTIKTKDGSDIGSVASAVVLYEHIVILNDTSSLGVKMYDSGKMLRYHRLYAAGEITDDWTGEKSALGYLIFDDRIVQNFDSSVSAVDDFYRTDVKEFNPGLTKAKDLTIGNIDREWIANLGLSKNTVTNFFQGAIKEAGTAGAIEKIARTNVLDHGTTTIDISEQYMFNQSYFGENKLKDHIEVQLTQQDINNRPQIIKFAGLATGESSDNILSFTFGDKRFVHYGDPTFETIDFESSSLELLTAGEPLTTEVDYQTLTVETMPDVFDTTADYANIPTWDIDVSYKLGDLVRHQGKLYECKVNATGLSTADENVEVIGTAVNPRFPDGTLADISGVEIVFTRLATVYDDILALGTVAEPTLSPTETLLIDGVAVSFSNTQQAIVVTDDAVLRGSISNPSIADATDQFITINGVNIDFNEDTPADQTETFTVTGDDITPADIVETIIANTGNQTYTVSQTLSETTYSISQLTVDSVVYTEGTDWSIIGQTITFVNPNFVGGETIEITLTHQPVYDNIQTVFTVTVETLGTLWAVSEVTVNGNPTTNYTVSSQDVTLGFEPEFGDTVVVTVKHIPATLNLQEIIDKINSKSIAGVTANVSTDGFSRLEIRLTTTNPNETLELGPSDTNALLGFSVDGRIALPPAETQIVNADMDLDTIITQINNAAITNVIAGKLGTQLLLTSTNTTLVLDGSALPLLGLNTNYTAQETQIPTFTSMIQAVEKINQELESAGVDNVSASVDNNRIKLTSSENVLDLGDTEFNTIAGLPTGEQIVVSEEIINEFDPADWNDISDQDPAIFSIWVSDDSAYEVNEIENVQTKFYGWNVFQAQNQKALYTKSTDGTDCGICAGNATRDGNDAEVTTQIDHGLQVGDYVMLLNTTTTPNIDGIHKVTKLGVGSNAGRIFYIDRFIEECGNAASVIPLRTQRFLTDLDLNTAAGLPQWSIPVGSYVWTGFKNSEQSRETRVYKLTAGGWAYERKTDTRVTNRDIQNAVIYDSNTNRVVAEFEVFDPIRGIIPGVADRELDFKTTFDPATYNISTDDYYSTDQDDAWAEKQLGMRWWNTGKARYYDYDQGPLAYRAANWGRQFENSEIEVWEWTKSTMAPDDYANAVEFGNEIEMFGVIATGEPYSIFDPVSNETLYYYTKIQEWDAAQGKYRDVYYFWVKNKTANWNPDHLLTAKSLADIIDNPTANNISWIAAISNNAVIISNVNYYLTDDSTVLQINKKNSGHAHNNWMLISKDRDQIPDYWYIGVRNNLAGVDANDDKIPDFNLNPLNRYGDDRTIRQAWFDDIRDARYNVTLMINELLQDVNIYEDLKSTWDTTISKTNESGQLILPKRMWQWADYISDDYNEYTQTTLDILSTLELPNIDTKIHQAVSLEIIDPDTEIDRSEVYYYIDGIWKLVRKNNATIEFDPLKLSLTHGWDTSPWDMISWDNTNIKEYWRIIIDACRYDLFTGSRVHKFNQLFFGIVEYTLSKIQQTNWVHKSTYISLSVTSQIETEDRRYKRNQINEILGYVNTVKPFHTKVSNVYDVYEANDSVTLSIESDNLKNITLDFSPTPQNFVGTIIDSSDDTKVLEYSVTGDRVYSIPRSDALIGENNWKISEIYDGITLLTQGIDYSILGTTITFVEAPQDLVKIVLVPWQDTVVNGGTFQDNDTQFEVVYDNGELHQPYNYSNSSNFENKYQGTTLDVRPQELLNILVQTNTNGNTVDADTRTFVYIQDLNENVAVYGLSESNKTTLAADMQSDDMVAQVSDGSVFALNGFAYINGEVVKFDRVNNTLYIRQRGLNGTFIINHSANSLAIDITNTILTTVTDKFAGQTRFNQPSLTILGSTDALVPNELAPHSQGIEI